MLYLSDIFQALTNSQPAWADQVPIADVVIDSRQARTGSCFVALKGEKQDGYDFVGDALARGAKAVIAESRDKSLGLGPNIQVLDTSTGATGSLPGPEPHAPIVFIVPSSLKALHELAGFWRRRFPQCKTIGVTGSIGKSSTKELIASVLCRQFTTLKSKGNLNNEIGLPLTLLQLNATFQRAVIEMGMYALGEIRELCRLALPNIGVVTNVGPSHLERLGSIDRIQQAKGELVQALPAEGVAILNGDDPRVKAMRDWTRARVFTYGLEAQHDLWADEIESLGLEGIAFDLHYKAEKIHVRAPLLGRHSVHTALAAASVGVVEGLSWEQILRGLKDVSAQLRLMAVPGEKGTTLLDDTYNASPESSLAALNLLADLGGRKVAVLGDMLELGSLEEAGHRLVGARAAEIAQVVVAVGERGRWIGEAAQETGLGRDVYFADGNTRAIEILREIARTGDMILVKGSRGASMEEIVNALSRWAENGTTESNGWRGP
jgi:UDP-N-acetylmuramoyl-tripeptide--D-alanyl-D-alanine ligase